MSTLSDYLDNHPVPVTFTYVGIRDEEGGRFMFAWKATVNGESFDYFTGSAHCKMSRQIARDNGGSRNRFVRIEGVWESVDEAIKHGYVKPTVPTAADLFYCLASDASACEMSFGEWCADYGYDEDSRKAIATYLACQDGGRRLVKAIGHATFNAIRHLEH